MSVLIKGMEMPSKYPVCLVVWPDGRTVKYAVANVDSAKTGECQAVPVPPHGRLGDLDKLEQDAQKRLLMCNKNDNQFQKPYEVMRAIALAPTIIPAEEGET